MDSRWFCSTQGSACDDNACEGGKVCGLDYDVRGAEYRS
jgi:hypothetical protein